MLNRMASTAHVPAGASEDDSTSTSKQLRRRDYLPIMFDFDQPATSIDHRDHSNPREYGTLRCRRSHGRLECAAGTRPVDDSKD